MDFFYKLCKLLDKIEKMILEMVRSFLCICGIVLLLIFFGYWPEPVIKENVVYVVKICWQCYICVFLFISMYRTVREEDITLQEVKEVAWPSTSSEESFNKLQKLSSVHEAGHVVLATLLDYEVRSVSIDKFGNGNTMYVPTDLEYPDAEHIKNRILICYAGAAAEEIFIGKITSGSMGNVSADYELATAYLKNYYIVTNPAAPKIMSDALLSEFIRPLALQFYEECKSLLLEHKDLADAIRKSLFEKKKLSGPDVKNISTPYLSDKD